MKKIISHIPNALTLCNLISGVVAIVMALSFEPVAAFWAVVTAAVFDFSDGMAARLLKAYSPLGAQLDSLADMVSFGVAPALIIGISMEHHITQPLDLPNIGLQMLVAGVVLLCCAALRLAKFNISTDQGDEFRGLPTPAMALFIVSYQFLTPHIPAWVSALVVVALAFMMVSRIRMFSLKFKSLDVRSNMVRYLFLALGVLSVALYGVYIAPAITIAVYIIYSIFVSLWKRS